MTVGEAERYIELLEEARKKDAEAVRKANKRRR